MVNEEIKAKEVMLVVEGEKPKVISTEDALNMAYEQELDLVVVANKDDCPLVKIMDYSKYLYEQKKKQKKNSQKNRVELKEIRMSPSIAENDLKVKAKTADRILADGDKLKITIRFPGRMARLVSTGIGELDNFMSLITVPNKIEKKAAINGNSASVVLVPIKAKH